MFIFGILSNMVLFGWYMYNFLLKSDSLKMFEFVWKIKIKVC